MEDDLPVFLFFHGGGWVTESIDNYERICARLASATDHIVVSVEYRLAPEYPFPIGFTIVIWRQRLCTRTGLS